MDTVTLTGKLTNRSPLRHSPAGTPVLNFTLRRRRNEDIPCVAFGELAHYVEQLPRRTRLLIKGWPRRTRRGRPMRELTVFDAQPLPQVLVLAGFEFANPAAAGRSLRHRRP